MKIQRTRRNSGFTLIELLVVIAIIAVLAAAGFAAGNAAIQKAKKVTALASATAIVTAVNNFHTEYGGMPTESDSDETVDTSQGEGVELVEVLLGIESGSSPLNTRGVKFLSVKEGKGKKGGLAYSGNGNSIDGLYDPWGGGFQVRMDCDYDEEIEVTPSAGGTTKLRSRVAVWSNGADGVSGGGKAGDDVKTW